MNKKIYVLKKLSKPLNKIIIDINITQFIIGDIGERHTGMIDTIAEAISRMLEMEGS